VVLKNGVENSTFIWWARSDVFVLVGELGIVELPEYCAIYGFVPGSHGREYQLPKPLRKPSISSPSIKA
jgi:hypothetical protein